MRLLSARKLGKSLLVTAVMLSMSAAYALEICGCSSVFMSEATPSVYAPANACACCSERCAPVHACRKAECNHRAQIDDYTLTMDTRRCYGRESRIEQVIRAHDAPGADAFSLRASNALNIGAPAVPRHLPSTILLI